ncbi:MAG: primosomal protein N' [Acidobacteriia bacterium]|nr:primosomal protein N' [Terriglobia bacterium]
MSGEGAEGEPLYATIAIAIPVRREFTYRVGLEARSALTIGARVRVPFGPRKILGTVVEYPAPAPSPDLEVRDIESVIATEPPVEAHVLDLARFAANYYLCSWGEAIDAAIPPIPRAPAARLRVRRAPGASASSISARAPARLRTFLALPEDGSPVPAGRLGSALRGALADLVRLGLVERVEGAAPPQAPVAHPVLPAEPRVVPTPAQVAALDRILPAIPRTEYAPFLLFGATGSGKTEVYLRAAEATLAQGRGVLYLVPEIGLTPLLVSRLARRFPQSLAVLHSGLAPAERRLAWDHVRSGEARLVVGARSAVFAPIPDPGLIVVDEEQDGSYKQEDTPRYNGRDLAVVRAREARALLVLGSATPSLESFRNAREGRYALVRLGGRVEDRPMPKVRIVDMRGEYRDARGVRPLSRDLAEALRACLSGGNQALVLRNRRGWASALHCPACGVRVSCSRCSVALTWHRSARRLRCHYCDFERTLPARCPSCGNEHLTAIGEGSERIEADLREALPGARIARMDRDTTRRRGAQEALLRRFDEREVDVLVGTQMIAKGHDFHGVTLVGVLSADQTLGLPDFRAAERTFQLLTQVAGRAGRGKTPGSVVIQAFDPEHPILRAAATQDYEAFYEREIGYRRALRYPPFTALVEIVVEDRDPGRASAWSAVLAEALEREGEGKLILSGPGPAPIERLKGKYRSQILVRSAGRRRLVSAVDRALASTERKVPRRAVRVDVDPVSLL